MACAKLSRSRPSSSSSRSSSSKGDAAAAATTTTTDATAHVAMIGAVGADTYGEILLKNLSSHGVDVSGVTAPANLKTGIAIIIVDEPTGQNRIVLSPEANHLGMAPGNVTLVSSSGGSGGGRPDLLIMQLEVPLQTVLAALAAAKQEGIAVLLNPAPAVRLPDEVYAGLAHLIVNETEASILSGLPVEKLDSAEGCREVAEWFVDKGVMSVVITLGGRGVFYLSGTASDLVSAEKVKEVVDTTAAGDTFVGQYALEVVSSKGQGEFAIGNAVRKANKAAARTVERKGAQDSIPWRDELV